MHKKIKTLLVVTFCVHVLFATQDGTAQEKYEVDNTHTAVIFSISHYNIGYVYGRFNTCAGNVEINDDKPEASKFKFSIESRSIDTNDIGRDAHLRGEEFFNVANYPKIEFESKSVVLNRGVYTVTGRFKMLDREKDVTIPFQLLGIGKGPFGNTRMGMLAKFSVKRSDFGMSQMIGELGNDVSITLSFEAVRK